MNVDTLQVGRAAADETPDCAPLAARTLSIADATATAAVFRALADPARVMILDLLATSGEPVCVCNLLDPLHLSQPTVSHHLKTLTSAGLLEREQRGRWAYFSLRPTAARRIAQLLAAGAPTR
jgi:ArsR family transcriptional regulator